MITSNEEIQRRLDEATLKADLRERYRSYDFTPVPESKQPRLMPHPDFWAYREAQEREIEMDEQLANRNGIPPLPTTRIHLFK